MSKVSIKDAEEAHKSIVTSQQKKIAQLYEQWADEIAAEAKKYQGMPTSSAVLKSQQLTQLEGALRKAGERTANVVNGKVKDAMTKASNSVIDDNAKWLESLGFPSDGISAAFSSVPATVVQNLVTGQIYQQGWSLSKSIWSDSEDTMAKAYQVVAGGMAENKSVYEIAKDLEQFVSPSAAKPWNYTFKGIDKATGEEKTYRVYPKRVDYNAQRLARTLSQHAYQQTMVAVNKDNPFVQKFRWHAIGGRACPICLARNGKLFDKNNVPMDHPNGMCILEPVYDKDVNQRLADWVNGKEDPALDRYAKQFGATSGDIAVKGGKSGADKISVNYKSVLSKSKVVEVMTSEHLFDGFDGVEQGQVNAAIYEALGIGGKPKVVDRLPSNAKVYYRGISNSEGKVDKFFDQLKNGKLYVSPSTSGNGINFANQGNSESNFAFAKNFATSNGRTEGVVVKAAFDESMKLVKYDDLDKLIEEFRGSQLKQDLLAKTEQLAADMKQQAFETMDKDLYDKGNYFDQLHSLIDNDERGIVAVLNGYDGVDSDFWTEYCIFNRTKLIIEKQAIKVR